MKTEVLFEIRKIFLHNLIVSDYNDETMERVLNHKEFIKLSERLNNELLENIYSKETKEAKESIIKLYLHTLYNTQNWESIMPDINFPDENKDLDFENRLAVLFLLFISQVKNLCIYNNIDFPKILKSLEIDISNYNSINNTLNFEQNNLDIITPIEGKPTRQIMLMYELGIFDYLINTNPELTVNGTVNYTKLAQTISAFTGLKPDTIRQTYNIFIGNKPNKNPFDIEKNKVWLSNKLSELGLNKKE